MKSHYNIILFDGSFFLYRNQAVNRDLSPNKLAGSFMQSIVKIVRDFDIYFDVGFLAFDKKPYHRTNILEGRYKDSRESFSYDDIRETESELENASVDDKVQIEAKLNHMKSALNQLRNRNEAIKILTNLNNFGLTTLSYPGYEADDLARIISEIYSNKYSILVVSIDSDWIGLVKDNVDYLRILHKGRSEFYDINSVKSYPGYIEMNDLGLDGMELSKYLEIVESIGIGHNDMRNCMGESNLTISEILANWNNLEKLKDLGFDSDTFIRQVSSFNFKAFPDYPKIKDKILNLNYELKPLSEFNSKFLYELVTGMNSNYYKKLYEHICNYSMLQMH